MINVAIIDDQQLFRESLADVIQSGVFITCTAQFANAEAFLVAIDQPCASLPNILLLDLEMPAMSGIELNDIIQKKYPQVKVIVLSVHANERLISTLIKAGVSSYLTKNCDRAELLHAIKMVHNEGHYINASTMLAIQRQNDTKINQMHKVNNIPINLSKREVEILHLICKEYNTADIANELFISSRTVEGHRTSLIQKIGCKNSAGLVLFAIRNSIFVPPF